MPHFNLHARPASVKKAVKRKGQMIPKNVVILPPANQSRDLTAPDLIRFFLQKELKSRKFTFKYKPEEVDDQLRQMGISDSSQIDPSNLQQIGQSLGADGVFYSDLIDYREDAVSYKTVIHAKFKFVDVNSGNVIWENELEVEKNGLAKIPVRGVMSEVWTPDQIRGIAKSSAGDLPRKLVSEALRKLPY